MQATGENVVFGWTQDAQRRPCGFSRLCRSAHHGGRAPVAGKGKFDGHVASHLIERSSLIWSPAPATDFVSPHWRISANCSAVLRSPKSCEPHYRNLLEALSPKDVMCVARHPRVYRNLFRKKSGNGRRSVREEVQVRCS